MPGPQSERVLSLRELNRALLARQFLLERVRIGVLAAVERLAGLQAQFPPSPYVALWSRLHGFERNDLTRLLDRLTVVKASLMRGTLHLVSAREYPAYELATLDGRMKAWRPPGALAGPALKQVQRRVLQFVRKVPRTREEIDALVAGAATDERLRRWLSWAVIAGTGLLWEPSAAHFEHRRFARFLAPPTGVHHPPALEAAHDLIVRRYLAAFGPASVADLASWSSAPVPPLRAALLRRSDLLRFRDDKGRELFDLPAAPRPDPDTEAPVRYLARFDAAVLGHAPPERIRILPEAYRKAVIHAAEVEPTFLVDGMVAGMWRFVGRPKDAFVQLRPFGRQSRTVKSALVEEGERLAQFLAPESRVHGVQVLA